MCQRIQLGNYFYTKYFLIYLFHEGTSKLNIGDKFSFFMKIIDI